MKSSANCIKVMIVDDHAVVRAGMKAILGFENDILVVGDAANGQDAVRKATELHPDVIIMDLMMPKVGGAEATAAITTANPACKILILTSYGSSADINLALKNGATGALMKTASDEQLISAIRKVATGAKVFSPEIAKMLKSEQPVTQLTSRPLEILESATRGLTNEDIAKQFNITSSGVKQHLSAIFVKLGAASRSEAIAIALKKQLLKI